MVTMKPARPAHLEIRHRLFTFGFLIFNNAFDDPERYGASGLLLSQFSGDSLRSNW
jgi:hypothetical protein